MSQLMPELLDVVGVEAVLVGVAAGGVEGEAAAGLEELVPGPGLGGVGRGRRDAGRVEQIGVVVEVGDDPAGADAVPLAVDGGAVLLLRLHEVVGGAEDRIGLRRRR